ncbi:UNVERIFIED_CONTAM: hypothetical protein FKN15_059008 [Acipenser sinensis]
MDDSPPQHRRLSLASIFCLLVTVLGMLLFALQFHGGEFIVGDDVAVGLYSFCLPNVAICESGNMSTTDLLN